MLSLGLQVIAGPDDAPTVIPESPPRKQNPPMIEEHEDKDFLETLAQLDRSTVRKVHSVGEKRRIEPLCVVP